jgi:hypothetical protein
MYKGQKMYNLKRSDPSIFYSEGLHDDHSAIPTSLGIYIGMYFDKILLVFF